MCELTVSLGPGLCAAILQVPLTTALDVVACTLAPEPIGGGCAKRPNKVCNPLLDPDYRSYIAGTLGRRRTVSHSHTKYPRSESCNRPRTCSAQHSPLVVVAPRTPAHRSVDLSALSMAPRLVRSPLEKWNAVFENNCYSRQLITYISFHSQASYHFFSI